MATFQPASVWSSEAPLKIKSLERLLFNFAKERLMPIPSEITIAVEHSSSLMETACGNCREPLIIPMDTVTDASVSPPGVTLVLDERQKFLVFLKIFCKYMEKTRVVSHRRHTKKIIAECLARSRQQDPECTSLRQVIGQRLRSELGEIHWTRAQKCFHIYCLKKGIKFVN